MMSSPPSIVTATLAKDRLGAGGVVQFALTAAAPLLVVAGLVTTGWAVTGVTALPAGFVVLAAVLAIFSVGYLAMARRIVHAGALYSYVAAGLGRPAGVATAFVSLLAYSALQVGLYGAIGPVTAGLLHDQLGWNLSWWECSLVAWALVATLGVLRVDLNSRVLACLLTVEIALVGVVIVVGLTHPSGGAVTVETLSPARLLTGGAAVALAIAVTGFIGFEQAPVYGEESKNPRRTIPAATYTALALMTVLYAGASWAMTVATGPDQIVAAARQHATDLMFTLIVPHLGGQVATLGQVLFITSMFAGLLAYHHAVARYAFALGREGVLWRAFARTKLSTGAPLVASLFQSQAALAVIVLFTFTGADPILTLFYWGGTTGALGILLALTATSAAVIAYFTQFGRSAETLWRRLIAPGIATSCLGVIVWWTLSDLHQLLGVDPHSPLTWLLPAGYATAAGIGFAWAGYLAARRPGIYRQIGDGPAAVTHPAAVTGAAHRVEAGR